MAKMEWQAGSWTNEPVSVRYEADGMLVEAAEGSDYWEKTLYQFRHSNGHALLAPWDAGQAVEVSFRLDSFTELYDQAGLMLWQGEERWLKAGIEVNDGEPCIAIVATDIYSDCSLAPVPQWRGKTVTVRASACEDAVIIRYRAEGEPWITTRMAHFPVKAGHVKAGPLINGPSRSGFKALFTRWAFTPPDSALHEQPPVTD